MCCNGNKSNQSGVRDDKREKWIRPIMGKRPQAEAGQLATNSFVKSRGLLMVSSVLTLIINIILWIFKWKINKHQSQVTGKHHKASYDWYVVEVWSKI